MNCATLIVNDEVIQASLSVRKENKAVSPSSSVGSGGDRLKKKRKPLDDEFLEGEGMERERPGKMVGLDLLSRMNNQMSLGYKKQKVVWWTIYRLRVYGSYDYSQLSANGNSGGIILIWDTRVFTCMEAVGDERSAAIKGSWNGKVSGSPDGGRRFTRVSDDGLKFSKLDRFLTNEEFEEAWKKEVRSAHLDCRFRDRLKNVKESLRVWSKDRFVGHKEKIEMLKNDSMRWELEAEKRTLSEVLEDIERKVSYDSNLDESTLLVTPLFDSNEDECFTLSDDVELLLHRDPSIPKMSFASILEGFTDEPPLKENGDLFNLESKENERKKILYDAPINDLMTEDKVFNPEIHDQIFSPTYVSLPFEDCHYLFFTYVIQIFLPHFTYLVDSPFLLSSGSEDTIFDPGISVFYFSHRSGTFISFNVYLNILNESLMKIFSSTCFTPNIMMIWGESS
nr:transposon TX1 [Tanacetum cinerariifolium]